MLRGIWDTFLARIGRHVESDEGTTESRFTPSPLDLSVREAHGGQDVEVERELSKLRDRAAKIEEQERNE